MKKNKESKFHKFLEVLNKKWLIKGTTTILLVASIFAIYIGVTIFLENVDLPQIDTTENKIYSLSEETKEKIGKIDKEITITLINYGDNSEKEEIINKYKQVSDKIKVENIADVTSRADLMQKYSLVDSQEAIILVACGDKEDILTEDDLSQIDYSTFETSDKTEQAITNAIIDVTTDKKQKVYLMSSHTEYISDYFSTFFQKMQNDANEVDELDILTTGKVPDDCDLLIIPTLKEDLTVVEKDCIVEYINNGGELLLLNGPDLGTIDFKNYQAILDLYGITMQKGIIIEQSAANMYYRSI